MGLFGIFGTQDNAIEDDTDNVQQPVVINLDREMSEERHVRLKVNSKFVGHYPNPAKITGTDASIKTSIIFEHETFGIFVFKKINLDNTFTPSQVQYLLLLLQEQGCTGEVTLRISQNIDELILTPFDLSHSAFVNGGDFQVVSEKKDGTVVMTGVFQNVNTIKGPIAGVLELLENFPRDIKFRTELELKNVKTPTQIVDLTAAKVEKLTTVEDISREESEALKLAYKEWGAEVEASTDIQALLKETQGEISNSKGEAKIQLQRKVKIIEAYILVKECEGANEIAKTATTQAQGAVQTAQTEVTQAQGAVQTAQGAVQTAQKRLGNEAHKRGNIGKDLIEIISGLQKGDITDLDSLSEVSQKVQTEFNENSAALETAKKQSDDAQTALQTAQAELEKAKSRLEKAKSRLEKACLAKDDAAVRYSRAQLKYNSLKQVLEPSAPKKQKNVEVESEAVRMSRIRDELMSTPPVVIQPRTPVSPPPHESVSSNMTTIANTIDDVTEDDYTLAKNILSKLIGVKLQNAQNYLRSDLFAQNSQEEIILLLRNARDQNYIPGNTQLEAVAKAIMFSVTTARRIIEELNKKQNDESKIAFLKVNKGSLTIPFMTDVPGFIDIIGLIQKSKIQTEFLAEDIQTALTFQQTKKVPAAK